MSIILTIGIPTYNRAYLLEFFFEKLYDTVKLFPNKIEIIVSDNASTDDTFVICKKWQLIFSKHCLINCYRNEYNIGVIRNIMSLLEKSNGDYFMFIGDDDVLFQDGLERVLTILESSTKPSAIIQGIWKGKVQSEAIGYTEYVNCSELFYYYGNTFASIIDRLGAIDVLEKNGARIALEANVWSQTLIGYLTMILLSNRPVYITDFEIGAPMCETQNITNKTYWSTSLFGLLTSAIVVDNNIGYNWIKKSFCNLKNGIFRSHLRSILWYSIVGQNTSTYSLRIELYKHFGFIGLCCASVLFISDKFPKFIEWSIILFYSLTRFKSPSFAKQKIVNLKNEYLKQIQEKELTKKRFGDWF